MNERQEKSPVLKKLITIYNQAEKAGLLDEDFASIIKFII
jgi:hypothetical protein